MKNGMLKKALSDNLQFTLHNASMSCMIQEDRENGVSAWPQANVMVLAKYASEKAHCLFCRMKY
jgi:hypothetical protein